MESKRIGIKPLIMTTGCIFIVENVVIKLPLNSILITGIARIIEVLLIIFIFCIFEKSGVQLIGLAKNNIVKGFKKGLLWSACFALAAGMSGVVIFIFGINPFKLLSINLPNSVHQILLFFIIAGIIAPIAEEVFFRGVLYGFIRGLLIIKFGRWGVITALILSTLMFVAAHLSSAGIPIPQLIGGVVFCLAYEIEGSLLTPIIIHSTGNLALFTISLIS